MLAGDLWQNHEGLLGQPRSNTIIATYYSSERSLLLQQTSSSDC
jgi:hypothetical protein